MAIYVISISSDSSEESVGTSTAQVILFGTIPTTIQSIVPTPDLPVIHDDTPLIPTDTPTTSPIILPAPPSLTRRPAVLVLPDSSLETSSDSHSDTSSDSSSSHSSSAHPISDSTCDSPTATYAGPSRKRCRSPTTSVPIASPILGALSLVHADLLPPRKRIRDFNSMTDVEDREIGLGVDVEDSYEPYTESDIDSDVQADIDACIAFVDDIASKGTNVRVEVETMAEEEAEPSARGTIESGVDRVTHLVVSDDTVESVREDLPELVSADGSLEVT
ncbi:hypothetical protein Tco_0152359 [Tanacetum coccineum]